MTHIKLKSELNCCCCRSDEELLSIFDIYENENKTNTYATVIAECFQIELKTKATHKYAKHYLICKNCTCHLKNAVCFRSLIRNAYGRLRDRIEMLESLENIKKLEQNYADEVHEKTHTLIYPHVKEEMDANCWFCSSNEDLFNMFEPHDFEGKIEIYAKMIAECFQVELKTETDDSYKYLYVMCKKCILLLRNITDFRIQIQIAFRRINDMTNHFAQESSSSYINKNNSTNAYEGVQVKCESSEKKILENDDKKICDICGKTFSSSGYLKKHVETVHITKSHPYIGDEGLSSKLDTSDIQSKNFTCDVCNKSFLSKPGLGKHKKVHANVKSFNCDVCGKTFVKKRYLGQHMMVHGVKKHRCKYCDEIFNSRWKCLKHMATHPDYRNFVCELCNKSFLSKSCLMTHKKTHLNVKNFGCDICGKAFTTKEHLKKHIMIHMGMKIYKCEYCGEVFTSIWGRFKHMTTHPSFTKYLLCEICNKPFISESYLTTHRRTHLNDRNYDPNFNRFVCEICNERFVTKSCLVAHKKTHSRIRKFYCDICGKVFTKKEHLKKHIVIHMGIKIYKCDFCEESFTSTWSRFKHAITHPDFRNDFVCEICNKPFISKYRLEKHKKTHMDISIFDNASG